MDIIVRKQRVLDVDWGGGPEIAPYAGVGDVAPGAFAFWGLRAYSKATAGNKAVNLRRSSDNATSDFNTLSTGDLDQASISTWLAGANAFVATLYDQTGNGRDATQGTAGSQGQLNLNALNGKATISGTQWSVVTASVSGCGFPWTVSLAATTTNTSGGGGTLITNAGNTGVQVFGNTTNIQYEIVDAGSYGPGYFGTAPGTMMAGVIMAQSPSDIIRFLGTDYSRGSTGSNVLANPSAITIGVAVFMNLTGTEWCVWSSDTGVRAAIETNIRSYWGI
jgi:hypothetical protein